MDWLVDTGYPSSFGNIATLEIVDETFSIQPNLLNLNSAVLSQYVKHEVVGLLGTDILDEFYIIFDTGAQISYIQKRYLSDYNSAGTIMDFYPGIGQFEIDTAMLEIEIGDQKYILRCGSLPKILNTTLMMTSVEGIIGNEVMKNAVVGYFPKENQLILV